MNVTAAALAGPPQLGRSVLVSPGQAAPSPWSACERLVVRPDAFTMEVGRRLRDAWSRRVPLVVELEGDVPGGTPVWEARWWELSVGMTMRAEVLSHLLSSNVVDARDARRARFAPVDAAVSLGAQICAGSGEGDVVTDSGPAWCDGGPLDAFDLTHGVIPAANLAAGSLAVVRPCAPEADLAGDQRAAVGHLGGAACIVAPAGSGKTRVLTERARYLVRDLGVTPSAVCLVAFNVRARAEMQERTTDLAGLEVRTLNSLALAICNGSGPFARPARHGRVEVIDEMGVRQRLDGIVKRRRRAMTDQLAPWLEALSASRLGLRDPAEVEQAFQPDVSDFVTLAPRYVDDLAADGLVDFDQQIVRAIDILLRDPAARATARRVCGVLLVDEFQDLTPAHLLLIRLLAGPRADVFGVGDDDQTIYGYSGASPQWLIDYETYFPGAKRHPLHVNYRCPRPVVSAAVNLLSHNRQRIDKQISAAGITDTDADADAADADAADGAAADAADADDLLIVTGVDPASALRDAVMALIDRGAQPSEIAVLARVNSTLLVPQILFAEMGVAADAPLGRGFLERTGVSAALAWLALAIAPQRALPPQSLSDAARRPPRGISPRVIEWIGEQRSVRELRALAGRLSDERTAGKIREFADDVELLLELAGGERLTTRQILEFVRDELGLGNSLDTRLDASRRSVDRSAHGDDLRALISVAHLHPAPAGFSGWLSDRLSESGDREAAGFGVDSQPARGRADGRSSTRRPGIRLATVHKVKGLEWPHVIVYEASAGLMPHRLAQDVEEERRVFHVALTRCSQSVTLVCDDPSSSFVGELSKFAPPAPSEPAAGASHGVGRNSGADADGTAGTAATLSGIGTSSSPRKPKPQPPTDPRDALLFEALRAWRLQRSRADAVPAFVVFGDAVLIALAAQRPRNDAELLAVPGIGPAKLEAYGAEALAIIAEHA
ncbi:ATP-dependent DNA helicase UvrD2 [Candidatus Poriferisodalis sp.]|uniref:ATP-dependent DNA helicase UvrD2 n=1 Tax=Candidatus Poriferisodalis sp. TaxID=3101277 RepID=UPI003B523F0F